MGRNSVWSAENLTCIQRRYPWRDPEQPVPEFRLKSYWVPPLVCILTFRKHPKVVFPCGYKIYHYQRTHALTKARIILTFVHLGIKCLIVFLIAIFLFTAEVNHYFIFIDHSYFFSCDRFFHVIYSFFYLFVIFFSFLEILYTKKSFFIYICYKPYSPSV